MDKLVAILQLGAATLLGIMAAATLVNLVLISSRPDTVSVMNALIGQGVVIISLIALANILFRKGLKGLRARRDNR
ncbi:MAG: hypothetical protein QGG54_08680 [Gammaproteobacteria bacterium]|jgi:hypothetical protein|nr:hypothetical protein [Gammaproteobacteria bacterium]MDP6536495.1 hypothetical protein [Gammaproteobacteria bacterium]MDP6732789.1 hypothetical protein [Gammaproteobacteria bacterium]HAJ75041.1 hypothetical protein [Gammaproteobacteria bacterium]|tara:strand:+ start:1193 stop:1420 length:228 start_codon:yes stop_codon:yes gene_type:complete